MAVVSAIRITCALLWLPMILLALLSLGLGLFMQPASQAFTFLVLDGIIWLIAVVLLVSWGILSGLQEIHRSLTSH